MKKPLIFILGCLISVSCSQKSGNAQTESELTTKKLTYAFEQDKLEVAIDIDYPDGLNGILQNALCEFFSEALGGSYEGDLADGQKMIDHYGEIFKAELIKEYEEQREDLSEDNLNGFYRKFVIEKVYETEKLVTFAVAEEIYMNGAHGMHYSHGQTFRKSDGRRFNSDMMRNMGSLEMHTVIKEGLREYFSEMSGESVGDEKLKDYILSGDDIDYLPMPAYTPYVTKDGIVFVYQPYEISFYAAGMPSFIVSLDDMKPYLTYTARQLLL